MGTSLGGWVHSSPERGRGLPESCGGAGVPTRMDREAGFSRYEMRPLQLIQLRQGRRGNTSCLDLDAFGTQASRLLFVCARATREYDPSAGPDNPMPG